MRWPCRLRQHATSRKVASSIPDWFNGIFIDLNLLTGRTVTLGSTHPSLQQK